MSEAFALAERELRALQVNWQREQRTVREQIRAERLALSLAERVERGFALRDLVVDDSDASPGGRVLLWVKQRSGAPFEELRISPGEPVRLWSKDPDGEAKEVAVVDLVRSNDEGELGFVRDTRRMNVALTRAKRFLMVVGDSATLAADGYYRAFMDAADARGAMVSAWADDGVW